MVQYYHISTFIIIVLRYDGTVIILQNSGVKINNFKRIIFKNNKISHYNFCFTCVKSFVGYITVEHI